MLRYKLVFEWRGYVLAVLLACSVNAAQADGTLYDKLGGQVGLTRIVHDLLQRASHDPRIASKFDNINLDYLETKLVSYICEQAGGPCHWKGPSLKGAHAELSLTDRHFNALVEDLEAAMDESGTPYRVQNQLLTILAPMHGDIVSH